ncbi:hypothetical protein [Oceaniglobus trochenteri]|uniref:hypothetical protein n=1 Tax=Oceaniglobus trochenteri TaxID=2763260 RepID=UPI001CFFDC89|nr:hypothetical protein [Oceaniglobus trochenteri]
MPIEPMVAPPGPARRTECAGMSALFQARTTESPMASGRPVPLGVGETRPPV